MYELKFRSYDFNRKIMVYYTYQDIIEGLLSTEYVYHTIPDNISDLIYMSEHKNLSAPMQHVGQVDMNGQDIYEGDIIYKEIYAPDDPVYGHYGPIGVIEKDEHGMGWYIRTLDVGDYSFYDYMGSNFTFDEIVIKGNIYENPDLI